MGEPAETFAPQPSESAPPGAGPGPGYKWVALSNTTLGILMAAINGTILIISLPAIFRGIRVDPLAPGQTGLLLWVMRSFNVATYAFAGHCCPALIQRPFVDAVHAAFLFSAIMAGVAAIVSLLRGQHLVADDVSPRV